MRDKRKENDGELLSSYLKKGQEADLSDGYAAVRTDRAWSYIDSLGKPAFVIPEGMSIPETNIINRRPDPVKNGLLPVETECMGYIDKKGEFVWCSSDRRPGAGLMPEKGGGQGMLMRMTYSEPFDFARGLVEHPSIPSGNERKESRREPHSKRLCTEAEFDLRKAVVWGCRDFVPYMRIEIEDSKGRTAWTNTLYRYD